MRKLLLTLAVIMGIIVSVAPTAHADTLEGYPVPAYNEAQTSEPPRVWTILSLPTNLEPVTAAWVWEDSSTGELVIRTFEYANKQVRVVDEERTSAGNNLEVHFEIVLPVIPGPFTIESAFWHNADGWKRTAPSQTEGWSPTKQLVLQPSGTILR